MSEVGSLKAEAIHLQPPRLGCPDDSSLTLATVPSRDNDKAWRFFPFRYYFFPLSSPE